MERKDLKTLAALGLTKGRADNNPVELTPECIETILEDIYSAEKGEKKNEKKIGAFAAAAVLGASLLLTACSGASEVSAETAGPGGEDGVFTIAYAPNESTEQSTDARNGLAEELSAALGCEVEEIQASDYNAIIEALRTDKADMAYMGPLAIALGVERAGVEPIVMKADDGDPEKAVYHSVLVTSFANTDINSIADIKGKTMAFVDPDLISPAIWCQLPKSFRHFRRKTSIRICFILMVSFLRRSAIPAPIRRDCRPWSEGTWMWLPFPTRFWNRRSPTETRRRRM